MNRRLSSATIDELIDLIDIVPEVSAAAMESVNRLRASWSKTKTRLEQCAPDQAGPALEILMPRLEEVKTLLNLLTAQLGILYGDLLHASEMTRDASNLPARFRADIDAVLGAMQPLVDMEADGKVVSLAQARRQRLQITYVIGDIVVHSLNNCQRILGFVSVLDRAIDAIEAVGETVGETVGKEAPRPLPAPQSSAFA